jgi:hypothetical protein
MFQESGQYQTDLMSDEVMGDRESTQAMDDDKSPSCGDDDDYNGLLCLILPLIYSYTIYNEKYFSDDQFSYIVRVLTWRAWRRVELPVAIAKLSWIRFFTQLL